MRSYFNALASITIATIFSCTVVVAADSTSPAKATSAASLDFQNEIQPVLSRHGCNSGGCHGKASGQNGFKLSLFGFDDRFDYEAIVRHARGRRITPSAPEQSLLLLKATGQVPHGGGQRLDPDSEGYQTLKNWIAAGAPASAPDSPRVIKLQIEPTQVVFKADQTQQLKVIAEYSNGERRDVTRQASFDSNLDVIAAVDEEGLVRVNDERGEAAIMARYMGQVAVFYAIRPHGDALAEIPGWTPNNYVDELVAAKWKKLGLLPSGPCDDATFLRRLTIDLCGRLPTSIEAREFLADQDANKRQKLIDKLLDSPDYPAYFATRWSAILRNSSLAGADRAAYAFHSWIKDNLAENRPYDQFVRGIVAAAGEWQDSPAINWYWQSRDDQLHTVSADTAQVFLGLRLQCARCHHHPYERWGQEDYYGLTGFFTRLGRKSFGEPPPYFASANVSTGEKNPLTGKTPEPKYLDGEYAKFTPEEDPRHALVDWMAKPENPFFAKVLVNRYWGHFFGRGIVHEVDDLRESNPPSNPELLAALTKDFVAHKFDMKHMIRTMVSSRAYQLSSEPTEHNRHDKQNYARYYAKRVIAEVFADAVDQATGSKTKYNNMSAVSRAVDLPHEGFGSYFLDTFDRPRRVSSCECERATGATLAQVLLLANSDDLENKIASGTGKIATLVKEKRPAKEIIDELYLGALARFPNADELTKTHTFVESLPADKQQQALEDILWAVLNTREFMFNR
ncbi:hypothetical protein ETAA8_32430 [Anatilimnocola aggregata]|uniref:S-layer protein n=1 Tax=Anatilimnocola aggregata TaxID=2528021 RepID=A0A517YD33_9BACT|nr:DUF1549 and DUF1553 domain-containing protein [Anatilimnocola aggregata]QDU28143.1 hypothetical protein ETAA8_32430 [Anatilimnocola aggregata]